MDHPHRIRDFIHYCLFQPEEIINGQPPADAVKVEGVSQDYAFHPGRLAEINGELKTIIEATVHPDFIADVGGGQSFLMLPKNERGELWCEQITAQELLVLAIACDMAKIVVPREFWGAFPGGVPYVVFSTEGKYEYPIEQKGGGASPLA